MQVHSTCKMLEAVLGKRISVFCGIFDWTEKVEDGRQRRTAEWFPHQMFCPPGSQRGNRSKKEKNNNYV